MRILFRKISRFLLISVGQRSAGKDIFQVVSGIGAFDFSHLLRSAAGYDRSAHVAALRPHVDDIIGGFYQIKVVLNDNDGVALIGQPLEYRYQPVNVGGMKSGRRFVKDIGSPSGAVL